MRCDLLHVRVDEFHHSVDRRLGERHVGGVKHGLGMIGTHMPSQQHVDVKIQRRNGFAHHFRQRVAEHALHLAECIRGTKHRLRSPAAQPAIDELFKIVS